MASNQEELLLALMSMGFEYENCREVIDDGITILEEAVQRLMNPVEPTASAVQPSSSVNLPPITTIDTSAQVQPSVEDKVKSRYERQRKERDEFERNEFKQAELLRKKQKLEDQQVKSNLLKEIASDRKQLNASAGPSSKQGDKERINMEREEYERKQKEKRAEDWKRVQAQKRKERQRVLSAIENDKRSKKKCSTATAHDASNTGNETEHPSGSKGESPEKKNNCRIQVNFPNNSVKTYTLPANDPLENLYKLCVEESSDLEGQYVFTQRFPKKCFSAEHFVKTLLELGLCPSCRLYFQLDVSQPVAANVVEIAAPPAASAVENVNDNNISPPAVEIDAIGAQPCLGSRLLQGNLDNRIADEGIMDRSSGGEGGDDAEFPDRDVANPQVLQAAIQRRLAAAPQQFESQTSSHRLLSLQKLTAVYIALQLLKKEPQIVHTIDRLNPTAANLIVKALQRSDKLTKDMLDALQPCKIMEINLDLCRLTSIDMLYALKNHQNLRRISLKSIPCVSDRVMETLVKNIPRISYLNLSDCEGIVGSFLTASRGLTRLKTLNLSRTRVKEEYLRNFLRLKVASLQELSLNKCSITENLFDFDEDYSSLTSLSVDETQIRSLSFLSNMTNLQLLSLKKTAITDEDVAYTSSLRNLRILELQATQITGRGLSYLQGKKLVQFSLPDRMCVFNESLQVLETFPLTVLDLSNFVNLDDGCVPSICKVTSLKHLYLSQISKLTDDRINQLKALRELETLILRNTNVTSAISPLLSALPLLHTLDLAATKVDNHLVTSLSTCYNLVKLNLSHTRVDDDGMVGLSSPRLSMLTLDGTSVTMNSISRFLPRCPSLSWIRNTTNNIHYDATK